MEKMMAISLLDAAELAELKRELADWELTPDGKAIVRSFKFRDFVEAFAFMTRVAVLAEEQDHHPEWRNVWNQVDVLLTTHDADGVTARDVALARAMDTAAG
jgi:4a-hydroxytetrahydrobiopterin dehydratase